MPNLYLDTNMDKIFVEESQGVRRLSNKYNLLIASLDSSTKSSSQIFSTHDLLFLEMDIDPIRNLKIGKFFKKASTGQPVYVNKAKVDEIDMHMRQATPKLENAFLYESHFLSRVINVKNDFIFLNLENLKTKWRITSIDYIHTREEVFVLKGVNNSLYLPSLNEIKIPNKYFDEISNLYSKLLDDLGSTPDSVVDHCRGLATSLLSALLLLDENKREDLEKLIGATSDKFPNRIIVKNCAAIINRLHPRRKPNEIDKLKLRILDYDDSEFAVSCISMMIRELGYGN